MRPGSRFLRKRRDRRNGGGPERQRRTFGNADKAGRPGALRKKREAEAQAETDPTFLRTVQRNRSLRAREPRKGAGEVRFSGTRSETGGVRSKGDRKERKTDLGPISVSRETIRACPGGDPERVPSEFASMDRPGNLEGASASGREPEREPTEAARPRPEPEPRYGGTLRQTVRPRTVGAGSDAGPHSRLGRQRSQPSIARF